MHHDETALRAGQAIPAAAGFLESFETLKRVVAGLGFGANDVQDILQDVFVQAAQRSGTLPAKEAMAWLVRVTVNRRCWNIAGGNGSVRQLGRWRSGARIVKSPRPMPWLSKPRV